MGAQLLERLGRACRRSECSSMSCSAIAPHSAIGLKSRTCVPVLAAVEDDADLLRQLVGLHEREDLEQLVARAEAAGKDHERLRQVREPELPHEEVVELEVQAVGDVRVRALLERQPDVQADRLAAGLARAAVGGLHDARAAARRDDEAVVVGLERQAPAGRAVRPARAPPRSTAPIRRPCAIVRARPRSARRRRGRRGRAASPARARARSRESTRADPKNTTVSWIFCSLKRRSGSRYSARMRIGRASALSRNSG